MLTIDEEAELDMLAWRTVADLPMTSSETDRYLELSERARQTGGVDWFKLTCWTVALLLCLAFWASVGYGINILVMP